MYTTQRETMFLLLWDSAVCIGVVAPLVFSTFGDTSLWEAIAWARSTGREPWLGCNQPLEPRPIPCKFNNHLTQVQLWLEEAAPQTMRSGANWIHIPFWKMQNWSYHRCSKLSVSGHKIYHWNRVRVCKPMIYAHINSPPPTSETHLNLLMTALLQLLMLLVLT
jgi:hypothetical protein